MGLFQVNYFGDSFADPLSGPLSSSWYVAAGAWQLDGGVADTGGSSGPNIAVCPLNPLNVAVTSQVTISSAAGGSAWGGVFARFSAAQGLGYIANIQYVVSVPHRLRYYIQLSTYDGGFLTNLYSAQIASNVNSYQGVVGLTLNSTSLMLSLNGVCQFQTLDTTFTGSGQTGIIDSGGASSMQFFTSQAPLEYGGSCCQ